MRLTRYFPILSWAPQYTHSAFGGDLLAAIIVTIMLIPQSLAYALLAGLPAEVGLYASILPLVLYAIFGTSRALAVGPVAVVSLMTAAAVSQVAPQGSAQYLEAAVVLALMSGLLLVALGLFRLGFIANFLSHPVISGFITASGIIIAASQLRHILGISGGGYNLLDIVRSLWADLPATNWRTLVIGASTLVFLFWVRRGLKPLLERAGMPAAAAAAVAKTGPVFAVVISTAAVWLLDLNAAGVAIVGSIPTGLPEPAVPRFDLDQWLTLAGAAALISVIGFVESVSVAQTLAAKKRERIDPDQELIGLGAANIASAFSAGYPVTGGFARSVVNFDAGARTPAAGAYTAVGIAGATLFLTPLLYFLPTATLAATIIVAVTSLIDFAILKRTFAYARADFAAVAITILVTLGVGVDMGVTAGVLTSLILFLYKTSRPHVAVVGLVPGTHHFRNINRHEVITSPAVLSLRIDESLYFANSRFLEDRVLKEVADNKGLRHVILMCSAVNEIDSSALESLEAINARLKDMGVKFHLSEVKGPVTDRLHRTHFLDALTGQVFLSQYDAATALDPALLSIPPGGEDVVV
ncbi:sulfate permease [Acuticoccus sp. MNP-M23]|uniref:SulP family inorganic anion transporter n=1 Tax=Acuticoccus sp. MNP-M23 TaxID=3072793 RepID=UPI0028158DA9|nr:sulfate permease [Acuticoccus sp. MNP-M23]WMS42634.1 sulfate permease [Acuticoccus sp. MNP-M23]